jgi:hypothetical protein
MSKLTPTEVVDSLTGWEEIAIEQATGMTVERMNDEENPHTVRLLRSLAAVLAWREAIAGGDLAAKYQACYAEVMGKTQGQVGEVFADDDSDDDVMEDDPDSEAGKDEGSPSVEPTEKPVSALSPE